MKKKKYIFELLILIFYTFAAVQKKKKKTTTKMQIDFNYLACDHHVAIISGLAFLKSQMLSKL